jgi:TatD DNase family protein
MIETHAHIYDKVFVTDFKEMLERSRNVGVEEIWMPNCNSETVGSMLDLADAYPGFCVPMIGLHPCYVNENVTEELQAVAIHLASRKFFMIGEIGLDFYWDLTFVEKQERAFLKQLELAKKYNLPVCIHSRNSKDNTHNAIVRCCELIEQFGWNDLRGIFHCFSGNREEAERVTGLNFLLGIGGVATFKNGGLDNVLPYMQLSDVVLETDSPYLAPVPYRGKRNEVSYIDLVAERVALLMGVSKQEVIKRTTENARRLQNFNQVL